MRSKRCGLGVLTGTVAVGVAGCGAPSTPTSSATPTAVATATATPAPPDTDTVTVVTTGVGTWQLVTIPVALLHNDATRHGAEEVVVHFSTRSAAGRARGVRGLHRVRRRDGRRGLAADAVAGGVQRDG